MNDERYFIWDDDDHAFPAKVTFTDAGQRQVLVTPDVLLEMLELVARNQANGRPFIEEFDAIEQVHQMSKGQRIVTVGSQVYYDLSDWITEEAFDAYEEMMR